MKTISLTEQSMAATKVPALYISQKPIVMLQKYKDDLAESEIKLERFIDHKITTNRFMVQRD